jgi:hypothetical protein
MTMSGETGPLWTQDQAIAYEAALEAINDVIAGYSEQIDAEENCATPDALHLAMLRLRTRQAAAVRHALDVTDTASVDQVLREYSAMVRARDAAETSALAA